MCECIKNVVDKLVKTEISIFNRDVSRSVPNRRALLALKLTENKNFDRLRRDIWFSLET